MLQPIAISLSAMTFCERQTRALQQLAWLQQALCPNPLALSLAVRQLSVPAIARAAAGDFPTQDLLLTRCPGKRQTEFTLVATHKCSVATALHHRRLQHVHLHRSWQASSPRPSSDRRLSSRFSSSHRYRSSLGSSHRFSSRFSSGHRLSRCFGRNLQCSHRSISRHSIHRHRKGFN